MPANSPSPDQLKDEYKNEALIWEHFDTAMRMHANGTGERTVHIVVRLQSEGAARQFSLLSVSYASAYETGNIDYIRVHKPDGSTVSTPVDDAIEMPAAVTREAPLYSDLKEKQLPVRAIAAGDVLEYQFHTVRTKAEAPGQFWGSEHFLVEGGVVLSQTLTLEVPSGKYVQVWMPNHLAKPVAGNGVVTYTWSNQQLKPTPKPKDASTPVPEADKTKDPDEDADGRKLPSVAWTTFHNWAEVGDWYRGLARDRIAPTPDIQARAKELTKDAKTPEEQVRALYDFVAMKTRYVGIDFGVGRYQPHAAASVLDHQYGDCKDKDTLLESLLRAQGFTTAPALIGVGIAPVPDLPSPALFNHVITTVEVPGTGRVWLDTTPEVSPYRVLIPMIRDEQALVVPDASPATFEKTPADPPFPYFERVEAQGTLDKDGLLKSHMQMTIRSDNELGFRILLQRAAPAQWDEAMQSVSNTVGFSGTVSNTDLKQADPAGPVHITYDYSRSSYADWDHLRILPLFPILEVTTIDKESAPDHDIDQGAPRTLEATTRIQLPAGYRAELPDGVHVKREYATFDKTYKLDKGELTVTRKYVILKKKVAKAEWKDYNAFMKATGVEEGESYITLMQPPMSLPAMSLPAAQRQGQTTSAEAGPTGSKHVSSAPPAIPAANATVDKSNAAVGTASADQAAILKSMLKAAEDFEHQGKWSTARAMLQQVEDKDAYFPGLKAMLGAVAAHSGRMDDAIRDYNEELANDRNSSTATVVSLADLYTSQKQYSEAEALLKRYIERNDVPLFTALARTQARSGDDAAALATLQNALAAHPHDAVIESALGVQFMRAHREKEAAAHLKAALQGTALPGILNDDAYMLSELKLELPLAEASVRAAIAALEKESLDGRLEEATNQTFGRSNLLAASWDTLAWVLFQQGRSKEAQAYARAAWFNRPSLVVGDHLGQILEALGNRTEAVKTYQLALASAGSLNPSELSTAVNTRLQKLISSGVPAIAGDPKGALADMETFSIPNEIKVEGKSIFRVLLTSEGLIDNLRVDGVSNARAAAAELNRLKVPDAIPPGSPARLVRDGVLTCTTTGQTCQFMLMSNSGFRAEGIQ